jgi:hypothetical protein
MHPRRVLGPFVRAVPAVVLTLVPACGSNAGSAERFLGTWAFTTGNESTYGPSVVGHLVRFTASGDGVLLDAGCRCQIQMKVQGDGLVASTSPRQRCQTVALDEDTTVQIDTWSFSFDRDGRLGTQGSGTIIQGGPPLTTALTLVGTLEPHGDAPHACDLPLAVGVIPYVGPDNIGQLTPYSLPRSFEFLGGPCVAGAGIDVAAFYIDSEDDGCTTSSGADGDAYWTYPGAVKDLSRCPAVSSTNGTALAFCRVDGHLFTALAAGSGQTYAVLKLSADCPDGAVDVVRHITTESSCDESRTAGTPFPNVVTNSFLANVANLNFNPDAPCKANPDPAGSTADLHFCVFQPAPAADAGPDAGFDPDAGADAGAPVASFPDLGFSYAVFHDFDGPQPPWVQSKRWLLEDDETQDNDDRYDPPSGAPTDQLARMVETSHGSDGHIRTCYEVARVR